MPRPRKKTHVNLSPFGLPFQKFIASFRATGLKENFTLRPVSIPLERVSEADILNLRRGNNFKQNPHSTRSIKTGGARPGPASAAKRRKNVEVEKVKVIKPKPKKRKITPPKRNVISNKIFNGGKRKPGLNGLVSKQKASSAGKYTPQLQSQPLSRIQSNVQAFKENLENRPVIVKIEPETEEMLVPIHPQTVLQEFEDSNTRSSFAYLNSDNSNEKQIAIAERNGANGFECPVCPEKFILEEDLLIHRRNHRFSYSCEVCPRKFDTAAELNVHLKSHERKSIDSMNGRRASHLAELDGFRPFSGLSFAELSRWLVCETCGESFNDQAALKVHYLSHFGLVQTPQASNSNPVPVSSTPPLTPRDGHLVPVGPPAVPNGPHLASHMDILDSYKDVLIQAEKIKKFAFSRNDSELLNKMLDVEKHVAGKIIQARTQQTPPN